MRATRDSPQWYIAACKNLALIEERAGDDEDEYDGDQAPTFEIFEAAKRFLKLLRARDEERLEAPKMFVSSEGHLLFSYGNRNQSLKVGFTPSVYFHFQHVAMPPAAGQSAEGAVELICKYFRI